jgi:hypothetical protein
LIDADPDDFGNFWISMMIIDFVDSRTECC